MHDPPLYYFYREVLNISPSVEETGTGITWQLLGYLALTWVVTYLCVIKGIKSSGKVIPSLFLSTMTGIDCKPYPFLKTSLNQELLTNLVRNTLHGNCPKEVTSAQVQEHGSNAGEKDNLT